MKIKYILLLLILFMPISINAEKIEVKLDKCIDGDTASFMADETIKVRFLAIDTPETKHPKKGQEKFGKEASEFTCSKLKNAKTIILEFDEKANKLDKYNRYLAWIWVDDKLLQKLIVENGLAEVKYLYDDYKYNSLLKKTEKKAKEQHLGIWNDNKSNSKSIEIKYIFFIIFIIIAIITSNKKVKKSN